MPTTLAQLGRPITPNPQNLPRAQTPQGIVVWAIVGVVLLGVIFAVVIKMRRDD